MTPTHLYIDNHWEGVEAQIREVAAVEIAEAFEIGEEGFADRVARAIARSVMESLDGSECETDRCGLRAVALPTDFTKDELLAIISAINYACQGVNGETFRRSIQTMSAYETAQKRLRKHYGMVE